MLCFSTFGLIVLAIYTAEGCGPFPFRVDVGDSGNEVDNPLDLIDAMIGKSATKEEAGVVEGVEEGEEEGRRGEEAKERRGEEKERRGEEAREEEEREVGGEEEEATETGNETSSLDFDCEGSGQFNPERPFPVQGTCEAAVRVHHEFAFGGKTGGSQRRMRQHQRRVKKFCCI